MMKADIVGECTPLLNAAKETLQGLQQEEGPRRRQGPQHQHSNDEDDDIDDEESSFVTRRSKDTDKKERRGIGGPQVILGRLLTASSMVTRWLSQRTTTTTTFPKTTTTTKALSDGYCSSLLEHQPFDDDDHYMDAFNDQSWNCSFGTHEDDGIWMNRTDQVGIVMAVLVWILITYSGITMNLLAQHGHIAPFISKCYLTICALALASHVKTSFTDPGTVPSSAVPLYNQRYGTIHALCGQCQSYKPKNSHHCRICNRCISRMDHHCPWMNNCVGAGNMKHFTLFLIYTWTGCALALLVFAYNYFLCTSERCQFTIILVQLVRAMTIICIGTLLFTSSMLMNITYGIMTGVGTIDRLKRKATDTLHLSDEEPMNLEDIFGVAGYWTWPLPIDPVFADYDRIMGFSTPQRLLREQLRQGQVAPAALAAAAPASPLSHNMSSAFSEDDSRRELASF